MFNSVSNTLITLLVSLVVGQVFAQIWNWGFVNATFDPALTAPDVRSTGASWGVIWGARKLLLTGPLAPEHTWRVLLAAGIALSLWLFTYIATRPRVKESMPLFGRIMNLLWLISPVVAYILLAGLDDTLSTSKTVPLLGGAFWVKPVFEVGGLRLDGLTLTIGVVVLLAIMSVLWFFKVIHLSRMSLIAWVLAWPIFYIIWRMIAQTGVFPPIDVDRWGGLLLTMIFAIFVTILSISHRYSSGARASSRDAGDPQLDCLARGPAFNRILAADKHARTVDDFA